MFFIFTRFLHHYNENNFKKVSHLCLLFARPLETSLHLVSKYQETSRICKKDKENKSEDSPQTVLAHP